MTDEPKGSPPGSESASLRQDIERLSSKVAHLSRRAELEVLWRQEREAQSQAFEQHKRDVSGEINKRLVGLSVVGLIVLGFAWWQISLPIRRSVRDRLNREFASKNIRTLISQAALRAAQSQTKEMMETTLKPAVSEALGQIEQQRSSVTRFTNQFRSESERRMRRIQNEVRQERQQERQSLKGLQGKYTKEISQLQTLVRFQENLKQISILKAEAVNGRFSAYLKLTSYATKNGDLAAVVRAAIIEVKEAFLVGKRTSGTSIWLTEPDGTAGPTNQGIPSADLESVFLLNFTQPWVYRAKAAELLGDKRGAGVPGSLVVSMERDPNLWVRRASLVSFKALTHYQPKDVFDFNGAEKWWEEHKSAYEKNVRK